MGIQRENLELKMLSLEAERYDMGNGECAFQTFFE
jgi:hypothetical protein